MLIGLSGFAQSGKDSVAGFLKELAGFEKIGFADALREMALAIDPVIFTQTQLDDDPGAVTRYSDCIRLYGYERTKQYPEVRRFLQRLGTEAVRRTFGEDAWVEILASRISAAWREDATKRFVVTDVRFPNEAGYVNHMGLLWRVIRPGYGPINGHESEMHQEKFFVHRELTATNLDELRTAVKAALDNIGVL